jgi:predicted site-specific integrase-resolvase
MERKLLTVKKCNEIYGLSRMTLINYEKKGFIKPLRTPGGVRRYKVEGIEKLLGMLENGQKQEQEKTRKRLVNSFVSHNRISC